MNLSSYFKEFLGEIEPSTYYQESQQEGHARLRDRLVSDADFKSIHVNAFLQGSYKRKTAIHPGKDVDIVVVTTLDPDRVTASEANARLGKCLRRYYEKVEAQNRSFGITLSTVALDVVLAASPLIAQSGSLAESFRRAGGLEFSGDWQEHPLFIPDRDLGKWVLTHPKRQLAQTTELNRECDGYFVPLVKLFKWWRREAYATPKYPKGYVLERIAGSCVDVTSRDYAHGFVSLLSNICAMYGHDAVAGRVPVLRDYGVPSHNVAHRIDPEHFKVFIAKVMDALKVARAALDETDPHKSADLWKKVFGAKFPSPGPKAFFPAAPIRPNKPAGFA